MQRKPFSGRAGVVRHVASAALVALCGCSHPDPAPPAAQPVLTALATAEDGKATLAYPGEVRARHESPLSFRVGGKLVSRVAHLGDTVKRGALLAVLDPADGDLALANATAALAAAEHRLALARQTHDRNTAQMKDDLVSRAELEQSDSGYAVAEAEVAQARAQLALARNQRDYTRLVATADGTITSEDADIGAVVAPGQAIFGMAYAGERDVIVDIPEQSAGTVAPGARAQVRLWSAPDLELAGTVREVAQTADPSARTFRVKVGLAEPQRAAPGMTATVRFAPAAGTPRVRIPATALFHDAEASAVWVVKPADGALELRRVEVAGFAADEVELAGGLAAGERVVAQGVHTVHVGQVVRPVAAPGAGT